MDGPELVLAEPLNVHGHTYTYGSMTVFVYMSSSQFSSDLDEYII